MNQHTESDAVAAERAKVIVEQSFTRAEPEFSEHLSWGNACHSEYNKYLAAHTVQAVINYETAYNSCGYAVGKIWLTEEERYYHRHPIY
jgi:hypothetical protein